MAAAAEVVEATAEDDAASAEEDDADASVSRGLFGAASTPASTPAVGAACGYCEGLAEVWDGRLVWVVDVWGGGDDGEAA